MGGRRLGSGTGRFRLGTARGAEAAQRAGTRARPFRLRLRSVARRALADRSDVAPRVRADAPDPALQAFLPGGTVAHLAGALGRPVWVLLQYVADWRWLRERSDNPWYPTARLFRQPQIDDWESVVRQVGRELA